MNRIPPPREEDWGSSGQSNSPIRRTCASIDVWLQNASHGIINHILWKILIVIFTIFLLLGRPCQFWFFPMSGDRAMNTLHLVGFGIFVLDMIFRSYLDLKYFPSITCNRDCKQNSTNYAMNQRRRCFPCIQMGSFNFWCDFFSTICFLLEVNFIFPKRFSRTEITIPLNDFGFPNSGDFAAAIAISNDFVLSSFSVVILIFKATRVPRLVPPKNVVDLCARLNLYWYFRRLTPAFYWRLFQHRHRQSKEIKLEKNPTKIKLGGGLSIATFCTVKAMEVKKKQMKEKGKLAYSMYILGEWSKSILRFLRILPNTNIELNRQVAATRIQRAWRNRSAGYIETRSDEGEGSHAWTSSRDLTSSTEFRIEPFSSTRRSRTSRSRYTIHSASQKSLQSSNRSLQQNNITNHQNLKQRRKKGKTPSQVGTAMAESTGHCVTLFLFANLLLVLLLTYVEYDTTDASTMILLHGQTTKGNRLFAEKAVDTARRTTIPNLLEYTTSNKENYVNLTLRYEDVQGLRENEIRNITVKDQHGQSTGLFSTKNFVDQRAQMELLLLVFVLLTWFFGVAAFAGPIMSLVVVPIERAVKLLNMLVMDPLGYRNTLQYKNFLTEADQIAKNNGRWSRDVLKGMETEFLMSTIVRIGSLMKVGFGSAGVQIIRDSLQKNRIQDTSTMLLNSQGSMVSCIFLFCDIRSFTDATECLQEEVFVFTNRIAEVVHSICSSYGGSANKNIGDAFLISWKLDNNSLGHRRSSGGVAKRYQADKALFSVVKICMALHHNDHYVEMLSDHAKDTLLNKLKDRPGPTVQLGFGLHAGEAVEGAIGSQRKIDATYVSMAVETAEYLESSTKKYKVPMLMSGNFHRLLTSGRRQRCRKIDRVMFDENESGDSLEGDISDRGRLMELFTYDIDIDALWNYTKSDDDSDKSDGSALAGDAVERRSSFLRMLSRGMSRSTNNDDSLFSSIRFRGNDSNERFRSRGSDITAAIAAVAVKALRPGPAVVDESTSRKSKEKKYEAKAPELVLPTGPALYSENIWLQADIRRIRRRYKTKIFRIFNVGLQKYYSAEWDEAKTHFEAVLDSFDDGPSKYYLNEMRKHDGIPPPGFRPFGKA